MDRNYRRIFGVYLCVQALLGATWWLVLWLVPASRPYFRPADAPDLVLLSLWLADLVGFVVGSLASGVLLLRDDDRSARVLWFTAGAVVYAALYCVGLTLATGSSWLATSLMVPAAAMTTLAAVNQR